jgi:hypothetical protein
MITMGGVMNHHKTIRNMPDHLWNRIVRQADKEGKLLHKFVIQLLKESIEAIEKQEQENEKKGWQQ